MADDVTKGGEKGRDGASLNRRIASLRKDYTRAGLDESEVGDDPIAHLGRWLDEAVGLELAEPTAATLATADAAGRPSARIVLLKGCGPDGLRFFTNYDSRKGRELEENPRACLLLHWPALERQVRVEGPVERLDPELSDAYFASRPRGSRIGAWASPQSRPIPDRAALERRVDRVEERFGADESDGAIPRPPHWGGYLLVPDAIELWQGRESRLHDRHLFRRAAAQEGGGGWGPWERVRLAP